MINTKNILLLVLLFSSIIVSAQYHFMYDLETPEKTIDLPSSLKEISGVSLCNSQKYLWAIQDEEAKIFQIEIASGMIIDSISFWKDGDYEAIEVVGEDIYVLKNTGTIYQVKKTKTDSLNVNKFNSYLCKDDDTEGLGFDPTQNRLLIACKNGSSEKRKIYAFDLAEHDLNKEVAFKIEKEAVHEYLKAHPKLKKHKKLEEMFGKKDFEFAPSAIAVHPKSGEIYVLSSKGKTLFVFDGDGTLIHIEKMEKEIHEQPEGICFDQKGNLFISNEGKKTIGKIYRFGAVN